MNHLYACSKMMMQWMINDQDVVVSASDSKKPATEADLKDKRFLRTFLVDSFVKSYLVLFEETLKSKETLNKMERDKLQEKLREERAKNKKMQEDFSKE